MLNSQEADEPFTGRFLIECLNSHLWHHVDELLNRFPNDVWYLESKKLSIKPIKILEAIFNKELSLKDRLFEFWDTDQIK